MEKFSQFRDKGSGIAPFLPIPPQSAGFYLPFHIFLYAFRIPLLLAFSLTYFLFLQWLPLRAPFGAIKRGCLWCILGIPGIWWLDLQIDGVKKGTLSKHSSTRLPQAGSIIASSNASPIDPLYLAAIFDPIFTASYPTTRLVERISLLQAVIRTFTRPSTTPPRGAKLYQLDTLIAEHRDRIIAVFPECTTSNGRGILPLSPSLLTASAKTKVIPINLRYTAADIVTPIPHTYLTFLWNLCSQPSHSIRIRLAEAVYNTSQKSMDMATTTSSYTTNYFDTLPQEGASDEDTLVGSDDATASMRSEERAFLDRIAEALARLGRVKRVGLGVQDKIDFVAMWTRKR